MRSRAIPGPPELQAQVASQMGQRHTPKSRGQALEPCPPARTCGSVTSDRSLGLSKPWSSCQMAFL